MNTKENIKQLETENKENNKSQEKEKKEESIIIARKFKLVPMKSSYSPYVKRVIKFAEETYPTKIEEYEKEIKGLKSKIRKAQKKQDTKENALASLKRSLAITSSKKGDCEKIMQEVKEGSLSNALINDYTFNLVRESMESEARRKNYILSWVFSEMTQHGVQYMDSYAEKCKFVHELTNFAFRKKGSKKGSLFDETEIRNILEGYGNSFGKELLSKIKQCLKDGLLEGGCSLPTYKLDSPFTIEKNHMSFSHDYDSFEELCEHIEDKDCKIYFHYGKNGSIANFRIDTGSRKNTKELNKTLLRLFSEEYKYCSSSIQLDKKEKNIILNLAMKIPKKETELNENTVVGVDLGIAIPAYCAVNNSGYDKSLGDSEHFFKVRTQMKEQRRRFQKSMTMNNGGHGKKKKTKAFRRFCLRERNFAKNYNHNLSKEIVNFAIKNHAKYIHMEDLTNIKPKEKILGFWSYYELQKQVEYKAAKYGIIVRYVNPYLTSQTCSCCGNWEEGQRNGRDFVCKKCGAKLHADYNAAKNISMSLKFTKKKSAY